MGVVFSWKGYCSLICSYSPSLCLLEGMNTWQNVPFRVPLALLRLWELVVPRILKENIIITHSLLLRLLLSLCVPIRMMKMEKNGLLSSVRRCTCAKLHLKWWNLRKTNCNVPFCIRKPSLYRSPYTSPALPSSVEWLHFHWLKGDALASHHLEMYVIRVIVGI